MAKKNNNYSVSDNEVLSSYLEAIDKIPLLSYEEEYELARQRRVIKKLEIKLYLQTLDLLFQLQRNIAVKVCLLKI